ncbi:GNAT family N-acetyltransferase [Dyadobacter flavalbus]|uniref:GNAT family N-acetyltransferase n=1 Tax=Dyadobacter flavalbus TaxID=2579942 RepID=A0A5M8QTG6_9BACT|nr:GNAT family N-acetyltransferase [Dyadobacter flavalbus]KAA6438558.1 GNAT family N-acetyltransferase [Dyadobacter flavalbus]
MTAILSNADPFRLEAAIAQNHSDLFYLDALAKGGMVRQETGCSWTYIPEEQCGDILFPKQLNGTAALDAMFDFYRTHPVRDLCCWSLNPPETTDLDVLLLARGFQPGWKPCWMALEISAIRPSFVAPADLVIKPDNEMSLSAIAGLPYAGNNDLGNKNLPQLNPKQVQRFVALKQGRVVAQTLMLFGGGVAGIYNVGVVPEYSRQGIGKAIVTAACLHAFQEGYHYVTLNANSNGRPLYEQLGFKWINDGLTWSITDDRLNTRSPGPAQVALAEAIGKGDLTMLDSLPATDLNVPLCNGMRPLELAAHFRQTICAEWLIAHGALCSVLDAWDMGWRDRSAALLADDPEAVNQLYGVYQYTLLHVAAERNDSVLAQLVLSFDPNLQLRDMVYQGTALEWARHLQRKEIEALIGIHMSGVSD